MHSNSSMYSGWQGFISEAESRALFGGNVCHIPAHDELHKEMISMFSHLKSPERDLSWKLRPLSDFAMSLDSANAAYKKYIGERARYHRTLPRFSQWIMPSTKQQRRFEETLFRYQLAKARCYAELKSRELIRDFVEELFDGDDAARTAALNVYIQIKAWGVYLREMQSFADRRLMLPIKSLLEYKPAEELVLAQRNSFCGAFSKTVNLVRRPRMETLEYALFDSNGAGLNPMCSILQISKLFTDKPTMRISRYRKNDRTYVLSSFSQVSRALDYAIQLLYNQTPLRAHTDVLALPLLHMHYVERQWTCRPPCDEQVDAPFAVEELAQEDFFEYGHQVADFDTSPWRWSVCGVQRLFYRGKRFTVPIYAGREKAVRLDHIQMYVPYTFCLRALDGTSIYPSAGPSFRLVLGFFVAQPEHELECILPQIHRRQYKGERWIFYH